MDIAMATCRDWPAGHPEDQLLVSALARIGLEGQAVIWDEVTPRNPRHGWLFRSVWDYHLRLDEFLRWVDARSAEGSLWNSRALIRWNAHKGYLKDLQLQGLPVIPTLWVRGDGAQDIDLLGRGWEDVVIKPAVGASAHRAVRLPARAKDEIRAHIQAITRFTEAMIQPYFPEVESYGERSFFFIEGVFTHAVRRPPALQEGVDQEVRLARVEPTDEELAIGRKVIEALPELPLYARMDLVPDGDGRQHLMEVELIEPRLFLREGPEAATALADALGSRIAGSLRASTLKADTQIKGTRIHPGAQEDR
ncbi:ATP-grasp domain-containing protein [Geothrix mesophila]|uniref:ATP-grasp domain-containing protein n=1 Tax=Geothrix mesophila TaxID=2922723 RepID=UPI001FADDB29|nr:hypothetical protein [Geothrix sp. SG198]